MCLCARAGGSRLTSASPQANDPDVVCGGDRFEALEAQVARNTDQCARCRAVPAILCGTALLFGGFCTEGLFLSLSQSSL